MRRVDWRVAVVLVLAAAAGAAAAWWWVSGREAGLRRAEATLKQAAQVDSALDSAADPSQLSAQRDALLHSAETQFRAVLARRGDLPEAQLGLAQAIWRSRQELSESWQHVSAAIAVLGRLDDAALARRRGDGRTGRQLLAAACAERAGFLLARLGSDADLGDPITRNALAQAASDVQQAVTLDPGPHYALLAENLERLTGRTVPVNPQALQTRPATKP